MSEQPAPLLQKSVDNSPVVQRRLAITPRVWAYQVAAELGVSAPIVSEFETGRRARFPDGRGRSEYLEALERIVAKRAAAEEAGAA